MTFFYNLNKKLDEISAAPSTTHGQLNERDEGKPGKMFSKIAADAAKRYGSKEAGNRVAGKIRADKAKAGTLEEELDEGFVDTVKQGAQAALGAIGQTLGHGSDEDMIRDLQKKAGLPQTGKVPPQQPGQQPTGQQPVAEKTDPVAFAALAEPKDKITFADKIAGAKKEVDEMLGDVAAEAIKGALTGGQKKLDKNKNGKIDADDLAMLRKGKKQVADEGFPTVAGARAELNKRKVGDVTHGAKHDVEEIPGGRRVTRRVDDKGYSVGSDTDDEGNTKSSEKRGRGRPKKADKAPERVTAKATKHKGGRKTKEVDEGVGEGEDLVKLAKVIASCQTRDQLLTAQKMANNFLKKHQQSGISNIGSNMRRLSDVDDTLQQKNRDLKGGQELDEKAVSKKQQKFMGMVHATQKGEKAPSKEVAKVAKTMKKSDAEDFASTKHKGLPEKAPKKKEKTEESGTTSGSVATSTGGKGKGGMTFGKGIYDSINREVEDMISESMNVNVSMNVDEHGEPHKSITVSAEGEAAEQLAQLLNLAGMSAQSSDEGCGCGTTPCSCDSEQELDENQPDWPTNTETNDDALQYAGGLNGPKSTGQTVGAPFNRQNQRQGAGAPSMGVAEGKDLGMKLYAELKSFKG